MNIQKVLKRRTPRLSLGKDEENKDDSPEGNDIHRDDQFQFKDIHAEK